MVFRVFLCWHSSTTKCVDNSSKSAFSHNYASIKAVWAWYQADGFVINVIGDLSISSVWNSSVQQPTKNGKSWNNTQQQTNGDASDLGVMEPLLHFPPLEQCALTLCALSLLHFSLVLLSPRPFLHHDGVILSLFTANKIPNALKGGS